MKTHTATLIDRHTVNGLTIRARRDNGQLLDIHVRQEDADDAGSLRGGGVVHYARSGSRWVYLTQDAAYAANEER